MTKKLTSPHVIKQIMDEHNLRFIKSLGQNFLIDENTLNKIINEANLVKTDRVLEIGAGLGTVTLQIAKKAAKIVAVEIDRHLIPALKSNVSHCGNVKIIHSDILKMDLKNLVKEEFPEGFKVVANLPYYITTPVIMKLLEEKLDISLMVYLVQKEVADRIMAFPGNKNYGALSVAVNYYAKPEIVSLVPKTVFMPRPKVDSAIVKLKVRETPPVSVIDETLFFKVVKFSFIYRRKTLRNALLRGLPELEREKVSEVFKNADIDENRRGETLNIEEFAKLCNCIKTCLTNKL
ncbi:MAG: rRNA (adenine1518-N6/adenine1519-N6)-dimethyltransferase [Thermosediminibacterales bacterium]|nr:rRNA (adenine1518-N6/adenine1519-N6)-dimethyltransferase [Thermosediminibacterales bacterium]